MVNMYYINMCATINMFDTMLYVIYRLNNMNSINLFKITSYVIVNTTIDITHTITFLLLLFNNLYSYAILTWFNNIYYLYLIGYDDTS